MHSGTGHQFDYSEYVTIGALWDILESRLIRGCSSEVTFYVAGESIDSDLAASPSERRWEASERAMARGFTITLPRLKIRTLQIWPGDGPSMYQKFDVQQNRWDVQDKLPFICQTERDRRGYEVNDANGLYWLASDYRYDSDNLNWRWSRSDGFVPSNMRGGNMTMGGNHPHLLSRRRDRAARRRVESAV